MQKITIYTDGGARGNPGPAGAGAVIYEGELTAGSKHAKKIAEVSVFLGERQTNNWAEYEAVALALTEAIQRGLTQRSLELRLDSQLVVEQLSGNYRVKDTGLKLQFAKVRELLRAHFPNVKFTHVPREENKEADRLVNAAIDRGI